MSNQKLFLTRLLNILLNPLNLKWKVVKDSKGILYPKPLRLLNGHSNFLFGGIIPKMFQTTTSRNRHVQRIQGGVALGLNITLPKNHLQKWRWICFALPHRCQGKKPDLFFLNNAHGWTHSINKATAVWLLPRDFWNCWKRWMMLGVL